MKQYDAIIIGSGQGGTPLAKRLANAGWKTALIEKRWIGGTCVNDGCTPTKAMIASATAAYDARHSGHLGAHIKDVVVSINDIIDRKNNLVQQSREASKKALEETKNLELFFGEASFTDAKKILVQLNDGSKEELTGNKIFIDTGTWPSVPPIDGLEEAGYLTSTTIMDLKEVPEHLLIVGGSYIGLEFGQMYSRFGSKITVLETGPRFLAREDEDIAAAIKQILEEESITIHTNTQLKKVTKNGKNLTAILLLDGKEKTIECSHILLAAGRKPNTESLGLAKAGVQVNEKGYIIVNEKLETTAPDIYALGDVTGGPQFTHISYNDYVVLAKNLLEGKTETTTNRMVPYCLYTDPELGRIGLTEEAAKKKGLKIKTAILPLTKVARATENGDTRGLMKAVVDAESKQILGAAILSKSGGELMTILQMAMQAGIPYSDLSYAVFAHPTYAEAFNNLFSQLDNHS